VQTFQHFAIEIPTQKSLSKKIVDLQLENLEHRAQILTRQLQVLFACILRIHKTAMNSLFLS
jgi:hypothetical protein